MGADVRHPELWNEICDFYYYIIPEIVWADDLRLRFKLLDLVAEYAVKQKKIPFREPELFKYNWRDETEILTASLTERYAGQMYTHLFFFQKNDLDSLRFSLAGFGLVATTLPKTYQLLEQV